MKSFVIGVTVGILLSLAALITALLLVSTPATGDVAQPPAVAKSAVTAPTTNTAVDATHLGESKLTAATLATTAGTLRNVTAQGIGIRVQGSTIHAEAMTVTATVTYDQVADHFGPGTTVRYHSTDQLRVERQVNVLGRLVPVAATGTMTLDEGDLIVTPTEINLGGPQWLDAITTDVVKEFVTSRQPIDGLPPGLKLTKVTATSDGLDVTLAGKNVQLTGVN